MTWVCFLLALQFFKFFIEIIDFHMQIMITSTVIIAQLTIILAYEKLNFIAIELSKVKLPIINANEISKHFFSFDA